MPDAADVSVYRRIPLSAALRFVTKTRQRILPFIKCIHAALPEVKMSPSDCRKVVTALPKSSPPPQKKTLSGAISFSEFNQHRNPSQINQSLLWNWFEILLGDKKY
jgi:hypothetical protein